MSASSETYRDPLVEAFARDVDRAAIRRNLALSVEERFRRLMELQRLARELRQGAAKAQR